LKGRIIISNKIISQTAKQLKKEKGLIPIGETGQMMGDIQAIGLEFQYFQLVSLEEARELLVYAIQVFLKNINENKKIRPYLHNYPFTTENIKITIWINQPDELYPPLGNLELLALRGGMLYYKLARVAKGTPWPILHEEALKTLANE